MDTCLKADFEKCMDRVEAWWDGPASHGLPVYKHIQAKGKKAEVLCESIEDARDVMAACAPDGLWLAIAGNHDRRTVDAFLREVEHWSQRK